MEDWINFWFRGDLVYSRPPIRKEKKLARPKTTCNPNGLTRKRQFWRDTVAKAYVDLRIVDDKVDIYLAAFLSCWLCVFVFPSENSKFMRPEIFKIASRMAVAHKIVNLAIPILARIYHGLNRIATSTHAGSFDACFPVHYVYRWLSRYFDTYFPLSNEVTGPWMVNFSGENGAKLFDKHSALTLIHAGISWDANLFSKNKDNHS